jgi:hypothetical protein
MRRFTVAAAAYALLCLLGIGIILIRGEGPHPRIVGIIPANGDVYWPGGAAQISFSQPMDRTTVERGLQVSPGSEGEEAWFGNVLNLQPVGDWKPDVVYHIALRGAITDDRGRPLPTPFTFSFRVHHIGRTGYCSVGGVRNVCELGPGRPRPLTRSPRPVQGYALSPDGVTLAYIRADSSGLPHIFVIEVDGTNGRQLSFGRRYADERPFWTAGDVTSVSYYRRPASAHPGLPQLWNAQIDGSQNVRL